jgi:hypothetical protein
LQGPQKFTQIRIFGLKAYHLATLVKTVDPTSSQELLTAANNKKFYIIGPNGSAIKESTLFKHQNLSVSS